MQYPAVTYDLITSSERGDFPSERIEFYCRMYMLIQYYFNTFQDLAKPISDDLPDQLLIHFEPATDKPEGTLIKYVF